jgi:outer membrane protein
MKNSVTKTLVGAAVIAGLGFAGTAMAHEKGDIVVRGGITNVAPNDDTSNVFVGGADLGAGLTVDSNAQLGLNFAYFVTDNINIEVLAATPFKHDVSLDVDGDNALGEVTHLPPSVTANYYFMDSASAFQPYVGAGLNFTIFFDEEFTSANKDAGFSDLDLDSSFGLTAQVGADYKLDDKWHVNASVRWIDIDTEASFKLGEADGSVGDIQIDPLVWTLSVGYTF